MTEGIDMLTEIRELWKKIQVDHPQPKMPTVVVTEAIPQGKAYQLTDFDNLYIHPKDAETILADIHDRFPGFVGDLTAVNLTRALNTWKRKQQETKEEDSNFFNK